MNVDDLDTPAVLVDLDIMERNIARMAAYCREKSIVLRPHTKTHKIPEIARKQIESGACGITVAKVGEAEVMAREGIEDILIAYPIVAAGKALRVAELAERIRVAVAIDSSESAECLSRQAKERGARVGILVEFDVGFRRCGVATPEEALRIARQVIDLPGLDFRGLMFFPGHLLAEPDSQTGLIAEVNDILDRYYEVFEKAAVPVAVVSGGSTPAAYRTHEFHGVTETRPGMYPFYDRNMVGIAVATPAECAVTVLVTVVSTAVPGRAILDGGSKTFAADSFLAGDHRGYGIVREDPQVFFEAMSEEHGHLDLRPTERTYRVGERLHVIPNHVCPTVNLHDEVYGIRNGKVETVWRVAGRGKVQ